MYGAFQIIIWQQKESIDRANRQLIFKRKARRRLKSLNKKILEKKLLLLPVPLKLIPTTLVKFTP